MNKVLVPFDGSESAVRALQYLLDLPAAALPAELHLLNVQEFPPLYGEFMTSLDVSQFRDAQVGQGRKTLEPAIEKVSAARLPFQSHVLLGNIEQVVVEQAAKLGCDHIVMGTRGHGALKGLIIGSVATKVIHLAKVPVTLVK
jgi:nucleotide-binding universal stress UspA family protein